MSKTRQEKIDNINERIAQLENQRKQELQKQKSEERKARDRRLYKRAALFESLLPDTINLTDEQFNTFLKRTATNDYGRDKLAKIIAEGEVVTKQTSPEPSISSKQESSELPTSKSNEIVTTQPQATKNNYADSNAVALQSNKGNDAGDNGTNPQTAARSGA